MSDLKILSNSRRNAPSFLGAMGDFLRETLDDDKLVEKLAPKYFNYWRDLTRHSGLTARMILKDFRNEQLAIIKSVDAGNEIAELVFFSSPMPAVSIDVLQDLKELVSNRWSQGRLIVQTNRIDKMCIGLVESLKKAGWKESSKHGYLEIRLVEKYKRNTLPAKP